MSNSGDEPAPTDGLPESLVTQIDSLDIPELKALLSHVEGRIDSGRPPIEEAIEANAVGRVVDIDDNGAYALVRTHPPEDGSGVSTDVVSLYHVRPEEQENGAESLHWAYLGDVYDRERQRCESCGRTFEGSVSACPQCGSHVVEHSKTEE